MGAKQRESRCRRCLRRRLRRLLGESPRLIAQNKLTGEDRDGLQIVGIALLESDGYWASVTTGPGDDGGVADGRRGWSLGKGETTLSEDRRHEGRRRDDACKAHFAIDLFVMGRIIKAW